jgi:hypothetical protein
MQRNHSRRLQKAPELNVAWHLRKKHLEGSRTHMTEVDPEGGQPQPDRPGGGPGRPLVPSGPSRSAPGAKWAQLSEGSFTAYEDQSKPLVRSV